VHTYKSSKNIGREKRRKPYFLVLICILRQKLASEIALSEARTGGQNLANEIRAKSAADGEGRLKDADVKLRAQITEAEKAIAAARSVAMTKVQDIATDAARAIVERMAGIAPADQDVAKAVRDALKGRS
jgi:F-type H+-transporting ATPase subunit b